MSHASLIEDMQEFGLTLHHAQGTTASLNVWLMNGISNKIPEFATHHVGVGALVVNSRNEILCVRELRNNFRPWKLPGGLSDLGEDIPDAACREVLEETGIHCTFSSIISFRHTHNMAHGRSDLYFVCKLLPIEDVDENGSPVVPTPVACEEEIEAAAWVPMEEYKAMIHGKDGHPMMRHVMRLYENECEIKQTVVSSIVPGRRPSPIYGCHVDKVDDDKQEE
jgi:8-oxo-dGTP pyrophosphatase MutT (NUDIX family)